MFYPPQDDLRVAMKNITDSLKEKSLPSPSLRISQDGDFFLVSLDNVIGRHNITFFRHYYVSNLKCCFEFCVPIYLFLLNLEIVEYVQYFLACVLAI